MLHQQLKHYFGFGSFNTGQEEVVKNITNGHSTAAIFPTGAGKSLCYQLSACLLPNLTVVVSPLLALISDQLDFLNKKGIPAARIDSTLTFNELKTIQAEVKSGQTKILMISVERFKNERFRNFLKTVKISLLVIDEAHCISEWGHNFRPDYLKLPVYRDFFNIPQVLLLTATATPRVVEDMSREFNLAPQHVVKTGFYRKNLNIQVFNLKESEKVGKLISILKNNKQQPTIIYVTLQRTAEEVANELNVANISAKAYHAGMQNEDREQIQAGFMQGITPIIVATIAFGMGIDKADIRRVVHYNLPKSIENYSQEIGRAGRDENPADCILLGNLDGVHTLENFVYGDTPELESIKAVLTSISESENIWEVKALTLSKETNIRQLPLKTLLVYLETEGIIEPQYSFYKNYRFKNNIEELSIIEKFNGERKEFINTIFMYCKKARTWSTIDFQDLYENCKIDRNRVIAALEYFHEQGWIQLEAKEMVEVYRIKNSAIVVDELAQKLFEKFKLKETTEIKRINQMLAFFSGDNCYSKQLSTYFGEQTEWQTCGHCSHCLTGPQVLSVSREQEPLASFSIAEIIKEVSLENHSIEVQTRFLCGITSPVFTSLKIRSNNNFGKLEKYRYADVKNAIVQ